MTKLLTEAFSDAARLPEEQQNRLAHLVKKFARDPSGMSGDFYWEALLADPRSEAVLEALAKEAEQEIAKGDVFDPDSLCEK